VLKNNKTISTTEQNRGFNGGSMHLKKSDVGDCETARTMKGGNFYTGSLPLVFVLCVEGWREGNTDDTDDCSSACS
jgi:hypothetical protein